MKRAFISYASKDKDHMEAVRSMTEGLYSGVEVFVDRHSIKAGDDWESAIYEAIAQCDLFIVVWSGNATRSEWVGKEVELAIGLNRESGQPRIVPIMVEKEKLKYGLGEYQAIKLPSARSTSNRYNALPATIGSICILCQFLAFINHASEIISLFIIMWLWGGIFAFSGLRELNSPWRSTGAGDGVRLLFGTLVFGKAHAVHILLFAILNTIVGTLFLKIL